MSDLIRAWLLKPVLDFLHHIARTISMNHEETTAALNAAADKAEKIAAEVIASTAELKAAIEAAGNSTPEMDAAMTRLQGALQAADDLNPDEPTA